MEVSSWFTKPKFYCLALYRKTLSILALGQQGSLPCIGHTAILNKIRILAVGRKKERLWSGQLAVPTPYARQHIFSLYPVT